jgi:hypothetical protein
MNFLKVKDYVQKLEANYPADSDIPTVIVQQLACLAAYRLAAKGQLPASCGKGEGIDMDVIHAGILIGLERLRLYDGSIGTLRAFLYRTIAGTIQNYAWKRENRVTDGLWAFPDKVYTSEVDDHDEELGGRKEQKLIDEKTPETILLDAERSQYQPLREAFAYLGKEDSLLLLKAAQIGVRALALELKANPGSLATKLARLRKKAREWALAVH